MAIARDRVRARVHGRGCTLFVVLFLLRVSYSLQHTLVSEPFLLVYFWFFRTIRLHWCHLCRFLSRVG